jgi:hypothetical protein
MVARQKNGATVGELKLLSKNQCSDVVGGKPTSSFCSLFSVYFLLA